MSANSYRLSGASRIAIAALMAGALALSAFMAGSTAGDAGANEVAVKAKRTTVLGNIGTLPEASCPLNCSSLAIVSGFQASIKGITGSYRVPFNGFITSWKISLGKPTKSQREFFETRFGSTPKAGISVIKPVKVNGKSRYKLLRRSPVLGLNKYLGDVTSFRLKNPIQVKKGDYVALTVPTWATALGTRNADGSTLGSDTSWRASRAANNCGTPNMQNSSPQTQIGTKFEYGCRFTNAQLLYRVTVTNQP